MCGDAWSLGSICTKGDCEADGCNVMEGLGEAAEEWGGAVLGDPEGTGDEGGDWEEDIEYSGGSD